MLHVGLIFLVTIIGGYMFNKEYEQEACDEGFARVEECKKRYDYTACRDLFLPDFCKDEEK